MWRNYCLSGGPAQPCKGIEDINLMERVLWCLGFGFMICGGWVWVKERGLNTRTLLPNRGDLAREHLNFTIVHHWHVLLIRDP